MNSADKNKKQDEQDPQLGPPAQANEEKHINFLEEEDQSDALRIDTSQDDTKQRRDQWQKGLDEGKKKRDQPDFQKRDLNEQEEY